jgi:hypothetical protein
MEHRSVPDTYHIQVVERLADMLDSLGVLRIQRSLLDFEYLTDSARKLGLTELLDRAIVEADT